MTYMFASANLFNGDVSTWDVSRVVDFSSMFTECTKFNGNLSLWNTNNGEYMTYMFDGAKDFHGNGLSSWGTGKVTNMEFMFHDTPSFASDISGWDVSNVYTMEYMVRTRILCSLAGWTTIYSHIQCTDAPFVLSFCESFLELLPSMLICRNGMFRMYRRPVLCFLMPHRSIKVFVHGGGCFRRMQCWKGSSIIQVVPKRRTHFLTVQLFVGVVSLRKEKA
jgi:surface protein